MLCEVAMLGGAVGNVDEVALACWYPEANMLIMWPAGESSV